MKIIYDINSCRLVIEDYERINWKDGSEVLEDAVYEYGDEDVSDSLSYDEYELFKLRQHFFGDMVIGELFTQLKELSDRCYKNPEEGREMVKKAEKLYALLKGYLNHILGELIEEELSKLNNK